MDSWYQPSRARYSPAVRGIPVKPCHQETTNTPSPKIVSIPVHFVGSETARSASALKIQKVFRGFLVRKSIKRIMGIKSQVDEIERRLLKKETIELIRKDSKERLRVNETLMSLLFKLDSIRGVYPGIRDCRKFVIKKAVALQEKVDYIVAAPDQTPVSAEDVDLDMDNPNAVAESADQTLEMKETADESTNSEIGRVEGQAKNYGSVLLTESSSGAGDGDNLNQDPQAMERNLNVKTVLEEVAVDSLGVGENCEKMDIEGVGVHSEVNADDEEECCEVKEIVEERGVEEKNAEADSENANSEGLIEEEKMEMARAECGGDGHGHGHGKGNIDVYVLERMMAENEKMMRLMSDLCERNEMQTRMLTSLTQRVDRLEKAFISDKLNKKKKKKKKKNNKTTKHTLLPPN